MTAAIAIATVVVAGCALMECRSRRDAREAQASARRMVGARHVAAPGFPHRDDDSSA